MNDDQAGSSVLWRQGHFYNKKHTTSNTWEVKQPQCPVNVDSDALSSQDDSLQMKGRPKNCMFLNFHHRNVDFAHFLLEQD